MRRGWLTPDSLPSSLTYCTISFPDSDEWHALVRGALFLLSQEQNFEEFGSLTAEETADQFRDMLFRFFGDNCMQFPVGSIMLFAGSAAPDNWLFCTGATVTEAGYPALFAVIGTTYGMGAAGTFKLPDLRGRVPVGLAVSGDTSWDILGETGGAKTHTLLESEMPSHNHASSDGQNFLLGFGSGGGNAGGGSNLLNGSPVTANRGGGGSHNNLQPYIALNYMIRYKA